MTALIIGVVLAIAVGLAFSGFGLDRDRAFYPVVTIVVASYYVLFAVLGGSTDALILEVIVGAIFLAAAVAGFRGSLWVVAVALAGHGVFDLIHPYIISNPGVPAWWPDFCLAYDVTAAAYLVWLLKSGRVPATAPLRRRGAPDPRWLELKIPPALVWFLAAGTMLGVAYAAPGLSFTLAGSLPAALALGTLGAALALAGVVAFRGRGTTVNPLTPGAATAVVSDGVYRVSRNPMYLGFLVALGGWTVYLSNVGAALLLPVFVSYMNRYQIKPEERSLLEKFGPEFAQYMTRVRRWL